MAKPHTPEKGGYTNPDVRFERTDIEPAAILRYGLTFAALVAASAAFILVIVGPVLGWNEVRKRTDLPPMAAGMVPAEAGPRLEAIEDLEQRRPSLLPPRAADARSPKKRDLDQGGPKALPIADAMSAVTRLLPAGKGPPPNGFTPGLPSGASAGRLVEKGGP